MADLLDELKEDLWQERLSRFLQNYWRHLIGTFILFVLVMALLQWNHGRMAELEEKSGGLYQKAAAALEAGDTATAQKQLEALASTGDDGYHALAKLQLAAMHHKSGEPAKALKIYLELKDSGADKTAADMAALLAGRIYLQKDDYLNAISVLEPISGKGRPWRYSALELLALSEKLLGHEDKAIEHLTVIKESGEAPKTLYQRTLAMLTDLSARKASAAEKKE